ncbi:MAG: hypothetical protein KatS3mg109_0042 [Pirellulaceae bacterium]|nr:MAG: hypothetical protein KatS3mg109_0042 [Pirellulaceae bacterium]
MTAQNFFQSIQDPDKQLRLDVDGLSSGSPRVWVVPDQDIDFGLVNMPSASVKAGDVVLIRDSADGQLKIADLGQMLVLNPLSFRGGWNPSTGQFPGGGTAKTGHFYIAVASGTVDGVYFEAGDSLYAIVNDASTTQFSGQWAKAVGSTPVKSVFGRTGEVVAQAGDYNATQVAYVPSGGLTATNVQSAIDQLESSKQNTLGYVPVDRAGDTMTGNLVVNGVGGTALTLNGNNQTNVPTLVVNGSAGDGGIRYYSPEFLGGWLAIHSTVGEGLRVDSTNAGGFNFTVRGNIKLSTTRGAFNFSTDSTAAGASRSTVEVKTASPYDSQWWANATTNAPYAVLSTSPIQFALYNTYTDSLNYERGGMWWDGSGNFVVGTQKAGTGVSRPLLFQVNGFNFASTASDGSYVSWRTNLRPDGSNLRDLGTSGQRWRNVYANAVDVVGGDARVFQGVIIADASDKIYARTHAVRIVRNNDGGTAAGIGFYNEDGTTPAIDIVNASTYSDPSLSIRFLQHDPINDAYTLRRNFSVFGAANGTIGHTLQVHNAENGYGTTRTAIELYNNQTGVGSNVAIDFMGHLNGLNSQRYARIVGVHESTTAGGLAVYTGTGNATQERVRVNGLGNVGIGINNPQDALDVNGKLRLRGGNWYGTLEYTSDNIIKTNSGCGIQSGSGYYFADTFSNAAYLKLGYYGHALATGHWTNLGNIVGLKYNQANIIPTLPGYDMKLLEFTGTVNSSATTTVRGLSTALTDNSAGLANTLIGVSADVSGGTNTAATRYAAILLGGNVGIGTASPTAPLHVSATGGDLFKVTDSSLGADVFRLSTTGKLTLSQGLAYRSGTADPTVSDIESGAATVWKNTTSGEVKLAVNDGGVIKSVTLT